MGVLVYGFMGWEWNYYLHAWLGWEWYLLLAWWGISNYELQLGACACKILKVRPLANSYSYFKLYPQHAREAVRFRPRCFDLQPQHAREAV